MISPAHLRARREALGVTRETVAAFSPPGTKATTIRDLERPRVGRWHRWHVDALDKIEAWFDEHAENVMETIQDFATAGDIDGCPVLWLYSQDAFSRCPVHEACLGHADLYNACLRMVREDLMTLPPQMGGVIDAEFVPDAYDSFRAELGTTADHPELRAKWWRHFSKTYKEMP